MRRLLSVLLVVMMGVSLISPAWAANGKGKAVFIIAAKNFQDEEFARPYSVLTQKGVAITVASTVQGEAVGMNGSKARVDMQVSDVRVDDFDAVIFIGGSGTTQYLDDSIAHELASDAIRKKKLVGAICMAPMILAKAGLLKGKKATVFPTLAEEFKQYGVKHTGKSVEKDGRIITADGPDSAMSFGQELAKFF